MTTRCVAYLLALLAALIFSACDMGPVEAAEFRFYVAVDGRAQTVPAKASEAPRDVAVDVAAFPVGKQVGASAIPPAAMGAFLADVRHYLALPAGPEVTIRWAQRQAGTTATTVAPTPTTTTTPTTPCAALGDLCGQKGGGPTSKPPCCHPESTVCEPSDGPGGTGHVICKPVAGSTTTTRPAGSTTTTLPLPGTDAPTMARLPVARDVSIRIRHDQRCRWWSDVVGGPLRTATQAERAAMFLEEVAVLHPEAMAYAKYMSACAGVGRGAESDYETDQLRLRSFYVDRQRDSEWGIFGQNSCHPYSHVENLLKRLQACSTANDKAAQQCAASFYMTGELLDATDMTIRNGRCVVGAPFPTPAYPLKEDQDLRERGHLFYTKPMPALTPTQRALACTVMALHQFGSEAKCGLVASEAEKATRLQAMCGRAYVSGMTARTAELDLLRSAVSERQKHLFLMLFTGKVDVGASGWTAQDVCDLGMLEHFAWHAWDAFLDLPGDVMWGFITRARVSHETFHLWAAFRSPRVRWRLGNHQTRIMDEPPRTQDQMLACLRDGSCRPPWLPSSWRILIGPERSHG